MSDPKPYKVLIIEDDPTYALPLQAFLNATKLFTVIDVTDSAVQAYKLIKTGLPDAIIFDLQLKEGDGFVLLGRIRNPEENLPIRPYILAITGNDSEIAMSKLRSGLADYVIKKENAAYKPQMVYEHLRLMIDQFHRNKKPTCPKLNTSALEHEQLIRARINSELDQYYMPQSGAPFKCLVEALFKVVTMPDHERFEIGKIYAEIGREWKMSSGNINVGICRLLQNAFRKTAPDDLARLYTRAIDYETGSPGAKEFIAYTANKIKNEPFLPAEPEPTAAQRE